MLEEIKGLALRDACAIAQLHDEIAQILTVLNGRKAGTEKQAQKTASK